MRPLSVISLMPLRESSINLARLQFVVSSLALIVLFSQAVLAEESCPRTIGADDVFLEPWPQADTWFGSESLAVILPENGVWPTTVEGRQIAVKLSWYSAGFQPGMEPAFVGRIERMDEGPNDAIISRPTNAGLANDVWTILTGIDFRAQDVGELLESIEASTWSSL